MSSGRVFRFAPAQEEKPGHLFVFLHGCGATAQSMIPIAFKFQARFPSAALVVPSGFDPDARGGAAQDWYPTRGLNCDNHRERVAAVLPDVEDLVRREQTNYRVPASRTVLIGFSQGGTVARTTQQPVVLAYLELMRPPLDEAISALVKQGATSIRVVPVFLGQGGHVKEDLPRLVERARKGHPKIAITLEPPIGEQSAVIDAIAAAITRPADRSSS